MISRARPAFPGLDVQLAVSAQVLGISRPTVVVNLAGADASIEPHAESEADRDLGGYIPALSSALVRDVAVTGDLLLLVEHSEQPLTEVMARTAGWDAVSVKQAPGGTPRSPSLLRSPQCRVGNVDLDLAQVLHDRRAPSGDTAVEARATFWFATAGTECGIHRDHDFIETHIQIQGRGRVQKFSAPDHDSRYEELLMLPGSAQPSLYGRWRESGVAYPWHQYRADSDCVWLVVEYHLAQA